MSWLAGFGIVLIWDSVLRFVLLALRAISRPLSRPARATVSRNGIILIAAHNEAGTIEPTVRALREHLEEWPETSLWVIADRCTDETAQEAVAADAQVAIRTEGRLGKGAVLAWWLHTHSHVWSERDCLIILDADSRLSEGSLSAFKEAMATGALVAQGFVAPHAVNRAGRLAGWSEVLMQRIDDEARQRRGWPVPLRGTGMVFHAPLLAQLAPQLHTLAEDLELDSLLAAQGVRVHFIPQARIIDPKPPQAAGAARQRARWLQGQLQVLRDYRTAIVRALLHGGAGAWFLLWLLFLRPKMLLMALRAGVMLGAWLIGARALAWVAATGLLLDVLYYLGGAAFVEEPARYCRDLLAMPRYAAMWMYGFGLATVRRGWLRAGR
jgi:cellulose synthase/poly-beta-1,6-N-acetylglucosamine synthase-like glycosyltransferase